YSEALKRFPTQAHRMEPPPPRTRLATMRASAYFTAKIPSQRALQPVGDFSSLTTYGLWLTARPPLPLFQFQILIFALPARHSSLTTSCRSALFPIPPLRVYNGSTAHGESRMNRPLNWRLWIGFLLCLLAIPSYLAFFARFPVTRDVPWATLLIFAAGLF